MRSAHTKLKQGTRRQVGLSLIEIMISLTLGIIVLAGVTSVFTGNLATQSTISARAQIEQDVRAAMEYMARDIRRSGYYSGNQSTTVNPFQAELAVGNPSSCILYAYDTKKDGQITDDDKLGFRLSSNALQLRRKAANCDAPHSWENLTDVNTIIVKKLKFTINTVFCTDVTAELHVDCKGSVQKTNEVHVHTYDVKIELTAQLKADPSMSISSEQTVRIKNESVIRK